MKLFCFFTLANVANSLQLNGDKDILINNGNTRTFSNLESYAAEIFNNDPLIISMRNEGTYPSHFPQDYSAENWTDEFMEYGCYCNKILRGGGRLPGGTDIHEQTCIDLYTCYKCINIDYDHEGTYAAEKMVYDAEISTENELTCLNPITHGDVRKRREPHDHAENCPRHVCECDKEFVRKMLNNHHICLEDANSPYCLNDEYRHTSENSGLIPAFVPKKHCMNIGEHKKDLNACCGSYPSRKPYQTEEKSCCDGNLELGSC